MFSSTFFFLREKCLVQLHLTCFRGKKTLVQISPDKFQLVQFRQIFAVSSNKSISVESNTPKDRKALFTLYFLLSCKNVIYFWGRGSWKRSNLIKPKPFQCRERE